ncbi:MAG: PAC2 family protein [Thermodesulfovibrionales bacterium]
MKELSKYITDSEQENIFLIIGWNEDIGKVAPSVTYFLNKKLGCEIYYEIEPDGFFSMDGVAIEDDCIQFPESRFYFDRTRNLMVFKSDQPSYYYYKFLNFLLDVPMRNGQIKELYTINGMAALTPHTGSRKIFAVFNELNFQDIIYSYNLEELTWEGPPAMSSFLLWTAKRRKIPGLSLWIEVPFYLAPLEDFFAIKLALSFFDKRFGLNLDIMELETKIKEQNKKIEYLRIEDKEVNKYIGLLESGLELSESDQLKLARKVYEHQKNTGDE